MVLKTSKSRLLILSFAASTLMPLFSLAQEPASSATAVTKTPPRMNPKYPPHIGADYYPKASLVNREQGSCVVRLYIKSDGSVPASQLVKSSGYSQLDGACMAAWFGVQMIPATINGAPVNTWVDVPVVWRINGEPEIPRPVLPEKFEFPEIADDYDLPVGSAFYPPDARAKHQRGFCILELEVGSVGALIKATVIRSTGSAILDKACIDAITPAKFMPQKENGSGVAAATYIAINW
jgi:protein TonB